jgi:hypothetical protein
LRIQFFLLLALHGGVRGGGVLFLDQCIRIFPGVSSLLGKRNTRE